MYSNEKYPYDKKLKKKILVTQQWEVKQKDEPKTKKVQKKQGSHHHRNFFFQEITG